jgi:hypothetical protein
MRHFATLLLTSLALLAGTSFAAEPTPPTIPPGYATEGRPGWVDFPSTEPLPWERFQIPNGAAGLQVKVLSRDQKIGSMSLMASVPVGWSQNYSAYNEADTEIFLLDGNLTIGDQKLTKYSYTFIPAGVVHGPITSTHGAVYLVFYNRNPSLVRANRNKAGARAHALVRDWNYYRVPFDSVNFPVYRKGAPIPGLRLKLLRKDPDTGEMTWITHGMQSSRGGSLWEVHPTFEEYYLLERSGEMVVGECLPDGAVGKRYGARGYWFRPAGVGHLGPFSYSTGYGLSLVRTGGPLWADYYTDCSYKTKVEIAAP